MSQMDREQRDHEILKADVLGERVRGASLSEFVEWLTAFAMCFRRAVVDHENPDPDIAKIAREMLQDIGKGVPAHLEGEDAEARRAEHKRIETLVGAMKPSVLADLMDEMAEGYRDVLLHDDPDRLSRFHSSLDGDLALVGSGVVHDLVRLDAEGMLQYTEVEGDREGLISACATSAAS